MKTHVYFACLALLGASTWLSACSDRDAVEPCDCPEVTDTGKWNRFIEPPVSGPDFSYHEPSYNPANGQQLVYRRESRAELNQRPQPAATIGLWLGEPYTGQQTPLLRGYDLLRSPSFGPRGWIAFNRLGEVWKVKANGDSLTRLPLRLGPHHQPRWSPDGTRLVSQQLGIPGGNHLIVAQDGTPLRTVRLDNSRYALAWSPDGQSLLIEYSPTGRDRGLATYDLRTDQLDLVLTSPSKPNGQGMVYGAAWAPDGKTIVWCGDLGLYKTDLTTRRTVRLRSSCTGRRYFNPAISPDGRQIAVERLDQRVSDDQYSMHTETNIWTLDFDGRNERKASF
jgi:Tol biopolymer transport system component